MFVSLAVGNLQTKETGIGQNFGNTVTFSANPPSAGGTVKATLPSPLNAAPFPATEISLLADIGGSKTMSVFTTLDNNDILFTLDGYEDVTKKGNELTASSTVAFVKLPVITSPATLPAGTAGSAYSHTLAATGMAPLTWENLTPLPPGLSLSPAGVISGTPSAAGAFTFTIRITDSNGPVQKVFSMTVNAAPVPPVAPRITGPDAMKLTAGYAATSTAVYTVSGTSPVTVAKTKGDDRIAWNNLN